ncbi:DUF935 domain-containing protein [Shewanella algae]|uniref:DUF935 domain-containing protein n=1 Tax=Shewanella algae TaxID=38313 RepID=UPI0031F52ED4
MILDKDGNPFKVEKTLLADDIARAYTTSVRNPRPASVAQTLNPQRLAALLRNVVDGGNPEDYMTLAEEMEERDLHYASVLRTRKLAVAAITPTVEAASEDAADIEMAQRVRLIMNDDQIPELLFDLLDGLGKGIGVSQILWDTQSKPWRPKDYQWVDPRFLRPDLETLRDILLISDDAPQGAPLAPYKFIVHCPRTKSGSVWRNGLARLAAVMYMLKSFTLRDWWSFAEVFGIPVRVGKYGPNASPEDISTLVNAISRIASDAGAVIPESMTVDLIETVKGNGGDTLFENMARWCDEQISKAVLGQTMTSDDGSSYSQANVHNEVRMDIAKWDARQLEACLNEYLVKPYILLNWGEQSNYPKVRLRIPEPEDLKMLVDSIGPLIDRGLAIAASDLRDKFGFPEPKEGDVLLQPINSMMPMPALNHLAMNRTQGRHSMPVNELDELTQAAMDEWQEVSEPMLSPLLALAEQSDSYEAFAAGLTMLASDMDVAQLQEQLAKLLWQSRALGDVGRE